MEKEVEEEMEGKLLELNNNEEFLEGEEDFPLKSLEGEKGGVGSMSATSSAIIIIVWLYT